MKQVCMYWEKVRYTVYAQFSIGYRWIMYIFWFAYQTLYPRRFASRLLFLCARWVCLAWALWSWVVRRAPLAAWRVPTRASREQRSRSPTSAAAGILWQALLTWPPQLSWWPYLCSRAAPDDEILKCVANYTCGQNIPFIVQKLL